ncbi:MAG: outer membrane protein assembly factor BamD [Balneolales bacterium]
MQQFGKIISIILILLTMAACGSRYAIQLGDTVEVAFEKAMSYYERERYSQAANAFETVLSIARGTDLAADAQYYLAQSYFQNESYLMAASEFSRFARNYTRDERRQDAEFMEAYAHYMLSPRYNLDQSETHNAIERFQLFVSRYPGTDLAREAIEHIDELRDKLAKKKFNAAEMYMRIREYRSAALYYGLTVEEHPESRWAEQAMVKQILAHVQYAENSIRDRQQERFEQAIESYQQYVQIFPNGENRPLAEQYYNRAMDGLAEVSTVTAGR